jgi:hypothetical protein
MADLHVYCFDDCEWVVAESIDDAWAVWSESIGQKREDWPDGAWEQEPDDKSMRIIVDDDGAISDQGERLELTCREWATREGRGYLCTTEY